MAKSSKEQQAEDERKILAELQKNSKENIDTIAKHCGFLRQKTWRFIKRLEENHLIWGYTAIVDEEKLGLQKFILSIKRSGKKLDKKSVDELAVEKLEKNISKIGVNVETSYFTHGEFDWVLIFSTKDIIQAKKFTDLLFSAYPDIVDKVNLSQILFINRDHNIINPDQTKLKDFL